MADRAWKADRPNARRVRLHTTVSPEFLRRLNRYVTFSTEHPTRASLIEAAVQEYMDKEEKPCSVEAPECEPAHVLP